MKRIIVKQAVLAVLGIVAVTAGLRAAQTNAAVPRACAGQEYRAFDYAVGTYVARNAKNEIVGKAEWAKDLDGCAIHFTWRGRTYDGNANHAYDASRGLWQKAFYSNSGAVALSEGHVAGGMMTYIGYDYENGKQVQMHRETLRRLGDGRLNYRYESSKDEGKTWRPDGNAFYTPVPRATFDALHIEKS